MHRSPVLGTTVLIHVASSIAHLYPCFVWAPDAVGTLGDGHNLQWPQANSLLDFLFFDRGRVYLDRVAVGISSIRFYTTNICSKHV